MLKVAFGKIDYPFTKNNLVKVLNEGESGSQKKVSDKIIASWCYEFYLSYSEHIDEQSNMFQTNLAKEVALAVSGQWEADFSNANGRVLSSLMFSEWLNKLGVKNV